MGPPARYELVKSCGGPSEVTWLTPGQGATLGVTGLCSLHLQTLRWLGGELSAPYSIFFHLRTFPDAQKEQFEHKVKKSKVMKDFTVNVRQERT